MNLFIQILVHVRIGKVKLIEICVVVIHAGIVISDGVILITQGVM
jgi:hypothetical protein